MILGSKFGPAEFFQLVDGQRLMLSTLLTSKITGLFIPPILQVFHQKVFYCSPSDPQITKFCASEQLKVWAQLNFTNKALLKMRTDLFHCLSF